MTTGREQILALDERIDAYDKIDRFLRNNLCDEDYEDYSHALEIIYSTDAARAHISELEGGSHPAAYLYERIAVDTGIFGQKIARTEEECSRNLYPDTWREIGPLYLSAPSPACSNVASDLEGEKK